MECKAGYFSLFSCSLFWTKCPKRYISEKETRTFSQINNSSSFNQCPEYIYLKKFHHFATICPVGTIEINNNIYECLEETGTFLSFDGSVSCTQPIKIYFRKRFN